MVCIKQFPEIIKEKLMLFFIQTLYEEGKIEKAKSGLLSLAESEPNNWQIWFWLARCESNIEKIKFYLNKMVELNYSSKPLVNIVWKEKSTQKLTSNRNEYDDAINEMYADGLRGYEELNDPFDDGTDIFED